MQLRCPQFRAMEAIHTPAARLELRHEESQVWVTINAAMSRELGLSAPMVSIAADVGMGPLYVRPGDNDNSTF